MKKLETPSVISYASLLTVILLGGYIFFQQISGDKELVYFDSQEVFENFNMTRELYATGNKEIKLRQNKIDSLYSRLNESITTIPKDSLTRLLIMENESLKEFNQTFTSNESLKIWARINSYANEFVKESNYKIVIGTMNNSMLIYGKEQRNVTKEFLDYINKKYEGNR